MTHESVIIAIDGHGRVVERRQKIEKIVRAVGLDNGLTPIKNLCPPDVGWEELKLVIAAMNK